MTDPRAFWEFTWPRAVARIAQVLGAEAGHRSRRRPPGSDRGGRLRPSRPGSWSSASWPTRRCATSSRLRPAHAARRGPPSPRTPARSAPSTASSGTTTCWSVLLRAAGLCLRGGGPHCRGHLGLFGQDYVTGANAAVVLVMVLGMLLAVASGPVDTLLLMAGRSTLSLVNTLIALAVDAALCLLLRSPSWASSGRPSRGPSRSSSGPSSLPFSSASTSNCDPTCARSRWPAPYPWRASGSPVAAFTTAYSGQEPSPGSAPRSQPACATRASAGGCAPGSGSTSPRPPSNHVARR